MSIADRMMGISLHYMGDQIAAREHIERVLARDLIPVGQSHIIRFQFDQRVAARCFQALILLLQGFPDQAMAIASRNVDDALRGNHAISLTYALSEGACPVSLFVGDFAAADRFATLLIDLSRSHGLDVWHVLGRCVEAQLLIRRGDLTAGLPRLRAALDDLRNAWYAPRVTTLLGELADATGRAGDVASGLAMVGEALARSRFNEERWCLPELLRIKGELILLERTEGAEGKAQAQFLDSLDVAAQHKVLSWQLRTAISLARLWRSQNRDEQARNLLRPIYGRFTEGFATPDLVAARAVLGDFPPGCAPIAS
jgi:predicted ATPase